MMSEKKTGLLRYRSVLEVMKVTKLHYQNLFMHVFEL